MTNKTKCLIKDLELQIDFLIGYVPTGSHWKKEYYIRQEMLKIVKQDENTPKEIKEKLDIIENSLFRLKNKEKHAQAYLNENEERTIPVKSGGEYIYSITL